MGAVVDGGNARGRRAALTPGVIAEFLSAISLFRLCERSVIEKVALHMEALEFDGGGVIQRAGAPDPTLGVLFAGRATVRQVNAATGQSSILEEVRVGDFFGEVGALLGTAQTTEVIAEDASTVLFLTKDLTNQLATKVAGFSFALARRLSTRVGQAGVASQRSGTGPHAAVGASGHTPGRGVPTGPHAAVGASGHTPARGVPAMASRAGDHDDGGMRFVRVSSSDLDDKVLALVPARLVQQHRLLPLEVRGRVVTVGMVDPFSVAAIADLKRVLISVDIAIVAISLDDFNEAFVRLKLDPQLRARGQPQNGIAPASLVFDLTDEERDTAKEIGVISDDVVDLASKVIATAIERGASDIHIENDLTGIRVRFRVQGQLHDWDHYVAPSFARGLVARFKVLAGLEISERRTPQDGRIGVRIGRREVDLRVSIVPASRGDTIVMRVVEAANALRPLDGIFIEPKTLAAVRAVLNRPSGMVIAAGPAGSGRSSTLYAAVNERRKTRPDTSVVMVEDPIELRLQGVTQVQVNHAVDLGFPRVLRAVLRQDPDVIMVGELRDPETAQLALEAAMTGHLLFSSLHAGTAIGAIQRLEALGVTRSMIAQSLALVLVQRLARKLCPRCVSPEVPPPLLLESLAARGLVEKAAPVPLPRAAGCTECNQTGFVGRVAVIETMQFPDATRTMLIGRLPLGDIERSAIESGALVPFRRYAAFLMSRNLLAPSEALLTVS